VWPFGPYITRWYRHHMPTGERNGWVQWDPAGLRGGAAGSPGTAGSG